MLDHPGHDDARTPDDVQQAMTPSEIEQEIRLTQAEAEAERVTAEAAKATITALGEALKNVVEQPGPKAALEGLGAMLHAQAQIAVAAEQHQHEQTVLAAKNAHDQVLEDKRNGEAQREREAKRAAREQWLGVAFMVALVFVAIGAGGLVQVGWLDKTSAGVGALFFATVLQSIFAQARKR